MNPNKPLPAWCPGSVDHGQSSKTLLGGLRQGSPELANHHGHWESKMMPDGEYEGRVLVAWF